MIPTREECFNLMDKYRVPIGVKKHCLIVNKIAVFLAKKLRAAGIDIDVNVVEAASLLHDLLRVVNFSGFEGASREDQEIWSKYKEMYGHMDHADAAYEELKDKYPRIATVVARHGVRSVNENNHKSWEDRVVLYADRRVVHTRIVSVEERYQDAMIRHADFFEKTGLNPELEKKRVLKVERDIFSNLKFKPEELAEELKKEKDE